MTDIYTPNIDWNPTLKLYVNNFINQLKIYSLDTTIADYWNRICFLFTNKKLNPIEWHQFGPICKNVRVLTETLINLNKDNIGVINYNYILELYRHILTTLDETNTVILRNGLKSAKRSFPLSLKLLDNLDDPTKVLQINDIHIINSSSISTLENTIDDLIERLDTFYTLVYGKSMGKRIIKIWTMSSSTTTIYVENINNDILGLTTILYMTVNNYKIAYISGLAVNPEVSRSGLGNELITILLNNIISDANKTNIDALVFGIEHGNSIMNAVVNNYRNKLEQNNQSKHPVITTFRGKSIFLPTEVTMYWVSFKDNANVLPTLEEIDTALLEAAKIATHEVGKTNLNFYMLAGSHFVRQWFHATSLGQYFQQW